MASSYLEVARVLEGRLRGLTASKDYSSSELRPLLELAAEEFGIPRDKYWLVYSSKRSKTSATIEEQDNVAEETPSCRHLCCEHAELMNADRWGTLPPELLQLVLAHLPMKDVLLLRYLSTDWKQTIVTASVSHFFRVCDEVHPRMFAFIRKLGDCNLHRNSFLVRVFDPKLNTWHALQLSLGNPAACWRDLKPRWRGMADNDGASDGGLVLFYLETQPKRKIHLRSFFYTVVNPLTQRCLDLPPVLDVIDVHLHRITLDRETGRYKVLIVVEREEAKEAKEVQVFDSDTGEWSQPNEATDIMFGNQSADDFAKRQLLEEEYAEQSPLYEKNVKSHTFLKNRLFVLVKDVDGPGGDVLTNQPMYYIKEYAVKDHHQHPPKWLAVETHRCVPFERAPKRNEYRFTLHSANGYLMVFAGINERDPYRNDKGWIYDLSMRTWQDLRNLPGPPVGVSSDTPCEIRWNAHP